MHTGTSPTTPRTPAARPTPQPRAVVCPYCGTVSGDTIKCDRCGGRFDPLSRQATQNAMGPWRMRDEAVPSRPGCNYETLRKLVDGGRVTRSSVIAGPTTRQFWMLAGRVPGVAHLLGVCHSCQAEVEREQYACTRCGAVFEVDKDRQHLGLGPARLLPGHGSPERIAAFSRASHAAVEHPSWSWNQGVGSIDAGADEIGPAPVHEPHARTHDDDAERTRARRLERRLVSQQRAIQVLVVVSVVLCAGLLALAFLSRFRDASPPQTRTSDNVMAPATIEPLDHAPGAQASRDGRPPEDGTATPAIDPDAGAELAPTAGGWEAVRTRVLTLVAQGTDEALTAAVLELESVQRRGELPEEGAELLARLRTELEGRQVRSLP